MTDQDKLQMGDNRFQFNVDAKDAVIIERHFMGITKRDLEIESLAIPLRPLWLRFLLKAIRFYQKYISDKLGNRCVFDPSCSHYAELAFRNKGFLDGLKLTVSRLRRCRPENGGVDELNKLNKSNKSNK
jgi:putative membrane protein insertion efficiency factor